MSPLTESTRLTLAKGQPVPNDPSFAFNSLLLHGNGTNGSTVITDSSGSPKAVTAVGNAQISTAIADPFGNSSRGVIAFDGTGDYLTVPANSAFEFETGNFTAEVWVRPQRITNANGQLIAGTYAFTGGSDKGWALNITSSGAADFFFCGTSAGFDQITASSPLVVNQWSHLAATRFGTTIGLFVNGIQAASGTSSRNENYNGQLTVASCFIQSFTPNLGNGNISLQGNVSDLRITKGVARYTSNFTPPTLPFPDF
jgi:hypothetical protein